MGSCSGVMALGLEQSTDGLSPVDLENHQHACALVCGWASLRPFQGARVQDSRLPVVSVAGRARSVSN